MTNIRSGQSPHFMASACPTPRPHYGGPGRSLLKIWPGIKVYGNSHRPDMLLGFNNHKTVIAHYISLFRSRVIWWMIQLVPSLKYNRSIDSAVNLALVNIQNRNGVNKDILLVSIWQCQTLSITLTLRTTLKDVRGLWGLLILGALKLACIFCDCTLSSHFPQVQYLCQKRI